MLRQFFLISFLSLFFSFPVIAYENISSSDYYLYDGDYNGDGVQDFVLFPHQFLFISNGVNVPYYRDTGKTPIVIQKNSTNPSSSLDAVMPADINKLQSMFNNGELIKSSNNILFGDIGNTGYLDIILQPTSDSGNLIVIRNEASGLKMYTFDMVDLGFNFIGSNSVTLTVSDGKLVSSSSLYGETQFTFNFSGAQNPTVTASFPNTNSEQTGSIVGQIPHTAWVDVSGAARYQVPIRLPSGINRLQPNLSLSYNSNRGNGSLGVGWSLAGIPSIRRCSANIAEDGFIAGITFSQDTAGDQPDRYCLNGQKLVSVSSDKYGTIDATYKTELESFQKITSVGGEVGNPQYWEVTDSQGNVWSYGKNTDATLKNNGKNLSWSISQIKDIAGNEVNYLYDNIDDVGVVRIVKISYGGTQVSFNYENRSDSTNRYFAGKNSVNNKRLSGVEISNTIDAAFKYRYQLSYQQSDITQRSILSSLALCGDKCVYPTIFAYQDQGASELVTLKSVTNSNFRDYRNKGNTNEFFPLNINGDGYQDFIKVAKVGSVFVGQVFINQKNGQYLLTSTFQGSESKERRFDAFDVDGDGFDDFVDIQYRNGNDRFTAWLSNGVDGVKLKFEEYPFNGTADGQGNGIKYKAIDVNGDGLKDLIDLEAHSVNAVVRACINLGDGTIGACTNTQLSIWNQIGHTETSRFMLIDTNADGLLDIFAPYKDGETDAKYNIFINNGNGSFSSRATAVSMNLWAEKDGVPTFLQADVNADGLVDIVKVREVPGKTLSETWLNTGNNEFVAATLDNVVLDNIIAPFKRPVFRMLDFNNDGASDLMHIWREADHDYLKISLSDSKGGFVPGPSRSLNIYTEKNFFVADTNGDGVSELVEVYDEHGGASIAAWSIASSFAHDKLARVDGGLAQSYLFEYALSSDANLYKTSERPKGVVRTSDYSRTLVKSLQSNNGVDGLNKEYYRYYDLKTHYQGIGSLGFAKVEKFDLGQNLAEVTEFNQDWEARRYASVKSKEVCSISSSFNIASYTGTNYCQANASNLLERESHNWVSNVLGSSSNNTDSYHVYKAQSLFEKWGASGDFISNRLVKRAYDTNGNLTTQTTEYGTLTGVQAIEKATYTYADTNLTNKHIFKPTSVLNEAWGPTIRASVNTTNFQYDSTGLLTAKISEPGKDEQITETYSGFDRGLPTLIKRAWLTSNTANSSLLKSSTSEQYQYDVNGSVTSKLFGEELSYSQAFNAHPLYDVQSSYTDINGQTTTTEVDILGRVTKVVAPQYTSNYEYKDCSGCGDNARYYVYKTTTAQPSEKQYYDTLGRVVKSEKQILSGAWSQVTTEYNTKGQVTKVSEPSLGAPSHFTTYVYDNAGRTILENKPAGDHSISYGYNGLKHTKTENFSGGSQTSTNSMNAFGLLDYGLDAMGNKTQYFYNGRKQLVKTIDVDGNAIDIEYDVFGNRTKLVDPDKGTWTFTNNAFGLVASENNGNGQVTSFNYDLLGRMTSRTNSEGTSTWQYDVAPNGVGQLYQAKQNGYKETYAYDGFGNLAQKAVEFGDGQIAEMNWHYVQGKLNTQTFPGGYAIKQVYNSTGYLAQIQNATDSNDVHWQANSMDARGNLTGYKLDGTLTTTRSYDAATGFVQTIKSGWNGESDAQLSSYTFDSLGNLKKRDNKLFMDSITTQANQRTEQSFTYDTLNRLASWNTRQFEDNQEAIQTLSMSYAANGNILSKPGVGNYTYGANQGTNNCTITPGPHAVSYIEGKGNYCYDASGNMLSGDGKTLTYTSFDKPKTINKSGSATEILYGPSLGRYKRIDTVAGETQTTWYLDGLYEKVLDKNSKTTERFYLGDFGLMERTTASNGTVMDQTRYFLKDHIGSVLAIAEGNSMRLLQEFHYDVWGKREYTKVYDDPSLPAWDGFGLTGRQGFTGHEMLDNVGLIHMNGRVYDPELARFVSADPMIQAPHNSQSFNRYSYVVNNPLSFTDPTGFVFADDKGKMEGTARDAHPTRDNDDKGGNSTPTPTPSDNENIENNQNDLEEQPPLNKGIPYRNLPPYKKPKTMADQFRRTYDIWTNEVPGMWGDFKRDFEDSLKELDLTLTVISLGTGTLNKAVAGALFGGTTIDGLQAANEGDIPTTYKEAFKAMAPVVTGKVINAQSTITKVISNVISTLETKWADYTYDTDGFKNE